MKKKISLLISALIITCLVGCSNASSNVSSKEVEKTDTVENTIPYPEGYDTTSSGASSANGTGNHEDSQYFTQLDFYNLKSTDTLTIIPEFKTYQQTTEYTCGPSSALMVLDHFGENGYDELEMADIMNTHKDLDGDNTEEPGMANERGEFGTSTENMVKFFEGIGWNVESSLTKANEDGYSFEDENEFTNWVIENLKNGNPIMVEWIDWAGHWQDIIGYDTMGTESFGDDVIIFADPYDTSDHNQDGYYIYPAQRFFYMWQDKNILPEDQEIQQWLIATPKDK